MLDNGAIIRITLEPLRLQKGFLTKAIMQTVCLRGLMVPQHCVNSLKRDSLSSTQGASQNVIARSHSGRPVEQIPSYKGGEDLCFTAYCKEQRIKIFTRCTVWRRVFLRNKDLQSPEVVLFVRVCVRAWVHACESVCKFRQHPPACFFCYPLRWFSVITKLTSRKNTSAKLLPFLTNKTRHFKRLPLLNQRNRRTTELLLCLCFGDFFTLSGKHIVPR